MQPTCNPSGKPLSKPTNIPTAYIALGEWIKVEATTSSDIFYGSAWVSSNDVILVGRSFTDGIAAKSSNRGLSWTSTILYDTPLSDLSSFTDTVNDIKYSIAPCSTGGIFISVDYGETWNLPSSLIEYNLHGVSIGSNGNAFAVGQAGIVYYSDLSSSYDSWSYVSVTGVSPPQLNTVTTFDGIIVYTAGGLGNIYRSVDGGQSWSALSSGTNYNLYSLSQSTNNNVMVLGAENFALRTKDGGQNWIAMSIFQSGSTTVQGSPTNLRPPHALSMISTSVAFAGSASGEVYRTNNGGLRWESETSIVIDAGQSAYTLRVESTNVAIVGDSTGNAYVLGNFVYFSF